MSQISSHLSSRFRLPVAALALVAFLAGCASSPASTQLSPPTGNTGILVIGGTGQLGSYQVNALSTAGERVIVLARSTSSFERLEGSDYEVVIADLRKGDEVTAAIMKAKPAVIVDVSNLPGIRMDDGDSFYWQSMRTVIAAADAAGVTQIIRHSARGARASLVSPSEMFLSDPRILNYMRDIARTEMALEMTATGIDGPTYTIVLNSNLPPEPATPTGTARLINDLTVNAGITRADLASVTNTCILNESCYGKTFNAIDPARRAPK